VGLVGSFLKVSAVAWGVLGVLVLFRALRGGRDAVVMVVGMACEGFGVGLCSWRCWLGAWASCWVGLGWVGRWCLRRVGVQCLRDGEPGVLVGCVLG
jgi:hypothetical protein